MSEVRTMTGTVKALVWNPFRAETPFGYYQIDDQTDQSAEELKGRPPFLLSGSRLDLSRHPTLADARAAAQADYERRVLSALTASASEPEPVAKFANDMRDALIAADNLLREHRLSLPQVKAAISLATTFRLHPQEDADTLKARAAAVLCEAGTLCGWPAPNCNAQEGAEALFKAGLLAKPVSTPDGAVAVSMTPEEHRLEDLKQMAAYSGPIVSFECREPYYLASCDHCGWVGSSELCGTDSFGDDSDVYCPRCHSSGADCGKVAETLSAALSHPADGWRDIASVPTPVDHARTTGICKDDDKLTWWQDGNPTHWMPLPAAPLAAKPERR